jgi:hypothetical protein
LVLNSNLSFCQADAETTQLPESGNMDAAPTAAKDFAVASVSTNPSASLHPSDPKFSQFECSDDDSEDDVPLSDLARVSSDNQHVSLKRPRPLSPSVPNEDPTILPKRRTASCCMKMLVALMIDAI